MRSKYIFLFVLLGVLFALSSCSEAGTETPSPVLGDYKLAYESLTVAGGAPVSVSPKWTSNLDNLDDVTYSIAPPLDEATTGLAFDTKTGVISGKPTAVVAQIYTVTAYAKNPDSYTGSATATIRITVTSSDISFYKFSYPAVAVAVDDPVLVSPKWTPDLDNPSDLTYSIDPPLDDPTTGLAFDTKTGVISGNPTTVVAQTYTVTAYAKNSGSYTGTQTATINITIRDTDNIEAVDISSYKFRYTNNNTIALKLGAVITEEEAITPVWDAPGLTFPNEVTYSIDPPLDDPTIGLAFDTKTGVISGTPTAVGEQTYTVTATDKGAGVYTGSTTATINITVAPIALAGFSYPNGSIDAVIDKEITVAPTWELPLTDDVSYSIAPPLDEETIGLRFDTETGSISGTPTTLLAQKPYTVTAILTATKESFRTASLKITITIDISTPALTLSYPSITAEVGKAMADVRPRWSPTLSVLDDINQPLIADADPRWSPTLDAPIRVRYTLTDETTAPLPAGLSLNTETGIISGTPEVTVAPAKDYSITATGLAPYSGTREVTVSISTTTDISTYTLTYPLATGSLGDIIVEPVWAEGTPTDLTVTYTVTPDLPAGLTLNSDGSITGSFANLPHASAYTVTATATGDKYTGHTTGVFLDTLLLEAYTPNTEGSPIDSREALERMTTDGTYYLANHIDLGTNSWTPLFVDTSFSGTLHGNGYAIYNLNIAGLDTDHYQGLFAAIARHAIVTNLGIGVGSITGGAVIGALAGSAAGSLSNITSAAMNTVASDETHITAKSTATIANIPASHVGGLVGFLRYGRLTGNSIGLSVSGADNNVGGLVGYNDGIYSVKGYATGDVSGRNRVGGLVGFNDSVYSVKGYATGDVSGTGDYAGGLVGYNDSAYSVKGYATGDVSGRNRVGGLMGFNDSAYPVNSYATGDVSGTGDYVGGLVGESSRPVSGYATGDVSGRNRVGGLVGFNDGNSPVSGYATGTVAGTGDYVGGLVGFNDGNSPVSGYATGTVTGTGDYVGGLVGYNDGNSPVSGYATGTVTGTGDYVGGLVGFNYGNTPVSGYTTGDVSGRNRVGGLVGFNDGNSRVTGYATGDVSGRNRVGGLVGFNEGNSRVTGYATGDVSGTGDYVGGLVGFNDGNTPVSGYATGDVSGTGDYVGGLVGFNDGNSPVTGYATGAVTGTYYVGGLVGENKSVVSGYATGDVSGRNRVGGLVGKNRDPGFVTGYATGLVASKDSTVGGIVGDNRGSATGYWDHEITRQNDGAGAENAIAGRFTGVGISATKDIVYAASATPPYTDSGRQDSPAIFTVTAFTNAFDLTGTDAASKTWPKLKSSFTVRSRTISFDFPQPTVSDTDGQTNAEGKYTIEVEIPNQDGFPEGWPLN